MAAGVSTKLWDVADLVDLLIDAESKKAAVSSWLKYFRNRQGVTQ